jgi:DNA polymerase-3 subunit gamma/tau
MSYLVLARKYRPRTFAELVGQEHVVKTLSNAIAEGRLAHAFLFVGPRGIGKTSTARILAKALNCSKGPRIDFDPDEDICKEIAEGRSLDVLEIDGASNRGINEIKDLRESVPYAPARGKFKIYIIDEVHMLSTAAFNALLKTLEEPPPHVKFLFATTDPEKVLPTILSRCQRFDLRRIPAALIVKHLAWIAEQEKVSIDADALLAIARGADGGMRDAESTLDQLISFCGDRIVESDVLSMFGLAARAQLMQLVDGLLEGDVATTLRILEELTGSGKDLGRLLADLLNHFRNLLLFLVSGSEAGLLNVSEAEMGALTRQAKLIDADTLTRVMEVLSAAEGRQREVASKRIFMEVTLLKVIQAREATSLDAVLKQLKAMRDQVPAAPAAGAPSAKANTATPAVPAATVATPTVVSAPINPPMPKPPVAPVPSVPPVIVPQAASVSSSPVLNVPAKTPSDSAPLLSESSQTIEAVWQVLMAQLPHSEGLLRAALQQSRAESWSRDTLTIAHPPDAYLDTARNLGTLQTVLQTITGKKVTLRFVVSESLFVPEPVASVAGPAASPRDTARPTAPEVKSTDAKPKSAAPILLNKDDFLNDPLIRQALEVFKGRIMEVRGPAEAN